VANEFDKAVKQINLLLNSRQLFLRTVMHELKTPIAKGRIVSELLFEEKQKDRLVFIFDKLNFLIGDFAKVEEIVSHNCNPNFQQQNVESLLKNAVEMLMLDKPEERISIDVRGNTLIKADFSLLSMVIKNLIDNGLKYSVDRHVNVVEIDNGLEVHSKGEPLRRSLESYFKPFHNEADMSKQGMGLGLYIIKSVLDIHEMGFEHRYEDGMNIFTIYF
jgi:two-component system OmpR family sensor kinase